MIVSKIINDGNVKHFPENKYWEFNPNSVYLGSVTLEVGGVYIPTTTEKYDLGIWISSDKKCCSLVFLENDNYTAYHSVSHFLNSKPQPHYGMISEPQHPLSVLNQRIIDLATEQGLLESFGVKHG